MTPDERDNLAELITGRVVAQLSVKLDSVIELHVRLKAVEREQEESKAQHAWTRKWLYGTAASSFVATLSYIVPALIHASGH
jgi:hypothetical protein